MLRKVNVLTHSMGAFLDIDLKRRLEAKYMVEMLGLELGEI